MEEVLLGLIATAVVTAALPGIASAVDTSYFVAKFDAKASWHSSRPATR